MDLSLLHCSGNPFTGVSRSSADADADASTGGMESDLQQALFPSGFQIPNSIKVRNTQTTAGWQGEEGEERERGKIDGVERETGGAGLARLIESGLPLRRPRSTLPSLSVCRMPSFPLLTNLL